MIQSLKSLLSQLTEGAENASNTAGTPDLAIAALLCQVSQADHSIDPQEQIAQTNMLMKLVNITENEAQELLSQANIRSENSASVYEFTDQLRELEQTERFELIQAMWNVAYADGYLDPIEEAVIRKVAELLYVDHNEFIRAKLSVVEK
ncbi:TerB family tellurite resistance protein [Vibrio sp. S17_S38]|uniref:tellurite resistance TerB family protein n=1 Tax=Vibrio sp. S17_S38 TaxID=2720229 RepID=UPI0016804597|nr:TerB family tellurite resistance protein [Vibrio sp. S17_S38]MBD1572869.1 TerB family tellurite resistance protein [Vibrio sp. S17_S38]